jgi:hypothetical protein
MNDMESMRLENERLRSKVETMETKRTAPDVDPSKQDEGESHKNDDLPEFEAKGDTFGMSLIEEQRKAARAASSLLDGMSALHHLIL